MPTPPPLRALLAAILVALVGGGVAVAIVPSLHAEPPPSAPAAAPAPAQSAAPAAPPRPSPDPRIVPPGPEDIQRVPGKAPVARPAPAAGDEEEGNAGPVKPAPPTRTPSKKPGDTTRPTKRLPDREQAELLYKRSCWQCHGERGLGDGPAAASLVGGVPSLVGRVRSKDAERLEDQDALIRSVQEGKGRMPAYSEDIDKADTRRILLYVRDALEGKAGPRPPVDDTDDDGPDGDAPGGDAPGGDGPGG